MKKSIVWPILGALLLSAFCDVAPAEDKVENNTITSKDLLARADSIFKSRDYDEARKLYQQVAETAGANNLHSALTEANAMIARTYLTTDSKEEGRPYIIKAGETAKPDEPLSWSRYLGVRGRFEWRDNKLETATATFAEMYEYCSSHRLHEGAVDAAQMAAITALPEQQIAWGEKGIAEAEAGEITGRLGPLWNNLGATYEDLGRFDESLNAYLKAREYHWRHGDEMNKLIADWAVGHAYRLCGKLDQAGKWLRPVLAWCERINEIEFTGWSCKELGGIELTNGNHEAALRYFIRAEENLKKEGMPDWDPEGYQKLIEQIASLKE